MNKTCFNYGCIYRNQKGYRKALRECKKNQKHFNLSKGFDDSETWNLECTLYHFLYNTNIIPEIRTKLKILIEYFDNGKYPIEKYSILEEEVIDTVRHTSLENHKLIAEFMSPRVQRFIQITVVYPTNMNWEEWKNILQTMVKEMKQGSIDTMLDFIFELWW